MKQLVTIKYFCPLGKHIWASEEWTDKDSQEQEELICTIRGICPYKKEKKNE